MKNSNSEIKRRNKISTFRELLRCGQATKPELAARLHLSLPTIGLLISELVEQGMVREDGMADSEGGRRAVCYCAETKKKLALGVDITKNHIGMTLLDLRGDVIGSSRIKIPFENSDDYDEKMNTFIRNFLQNCQVEEESLIGTGYSVPGIVSLDRSRLELSHILQVLRPDSFVPDHRLSCPYLCFNDADAACMLECYERDDLDNFVFISLSNTVGGALVFNKEIQRGVNGRCGEIGHMCVVPGAKGRMCYCGKRGHYDAYGSAELLAQKANGNLKEFFRRVEQGDPELNAFLDEYLEMLAVVTQNMAMFTDMNIVIGGYVGEYLEPYLDRLKEKVSQMDNLQFVSTKHIHLCGRHGFGAAAAGSALYFIEEFIQNV